MPDMRRDEALRMAKYVQRRQEEEPDLDYDELMAEAKELEGKSHLSDEGEDRSVWWESLRLSPRALSERKTVYELAKKTKAGDEEAASILRDRFEQSLYPFVLEGNYEVKKSWDNPQRLAEDILLSEPFQKAAEWTGGELPMDYNSWMRRK